jgi:catechol 2,3-dioxygenase-like lactoylglutathione lyase family enzyme
MNFKLSYVTITVSDLERAKDFYERILGFKQTIVYKPTKWYAYDMGTVSGGFAITKATKPFTANIDSLVDFFCQRC